MMNAIRYQVYRYDPGRTNSMSGEKFREIYKHFNIKMNKRDHEVVIGFLQERRQKWAQTHGLEQDKQVAARYDLR